MGQGLWMRLFRVDIFDVSLDLTIGIVNKTKDWALVQNAALVIDIKVLN